MPSGQQVAAQEIFIFMGLFALLVLVACGLVLWFFWQRQRTANKKFAYGLPDMIAAMVGLTPSALVGAFLVGAILMEDNVESLIGRDSWIYFSFFMLIAMVCGQMTGMIVGRVRIVLRGEGDSKGGWRSALSVFGGAIAGMLLVLLAFVLCGMLLL